MVIIIMPKNKKNNQKKINYSNLTKEKQSDISRQVGFYVPTKHKKLKRLGKECIYYVPEKLTCKLSKGFCKDSDTCKDFAYIKKPSFEIPAYHKNKTNKKKDDISNIGITAIVLSDNRKCVNARHTLIDMQAKLRISTYQTGRIQLYEIPAAYCDQCELYFVLKNDFKIAKKKGIILCPVIDRTQKYLQKHQNKVLTSSESRIHQLGYNVVKDNGYTNEQRHMVLANIIENTDISQHEVKSLIARCIAQHKNQPNYSDSIKCWKNDLEFIANYKHGDMPEVLIEKIIVSART